MTQIDQPFVIADGREPAELRALMAQNGYLFFKDFGPKDEIRALRRDILTLCAEAGWLDPEADLMDGVWGGVGPHTEGQPEYMAVYRKVIHLDRFRSLPQHPIFMQLAEIMTGAPALVHRRHIGRMTFPQNTGQTIMAHQDWYYIRGTPETYTMWLPLGDCPMELGGLAMLAGSHQAGFIDHRRLPERNVPFALEADQWPEGLQWHASDFELGDVVMFHAYTIHRALPNQTANRLRLSIDNRYQRDGEAIEPGSMETHYNL